MGAARGPGERRRHGAQRARDRVETQGLVRSRRRAGGAALEVQAQGGERSAGATEGSAAHRIQSERSGVRHAMKQRTFWWCGALAALVNAGAHAADCAAEKQAASMSEAVY